MRTEGTGPMRRGDTLTDPPLGRSEALAARLVLIELEPPRTNEAALYLEANRAMQRTPAGPV